MGGLALGGLSALAAGREVRLETQSSDQKKTDDEAQKIFAAAKELHASFVSCMKQLENVPQDSPTQQVVDALGGRIKFCELPELKWKDRFLGGTGYIDSIKPKELKEPVSRGIDLYGRLFIALRLRNTFDSETWIGAEAIFQRSSNPYTIWAEGCQYNRDARLFGSIIEGDQLVTLKKVVNHEPVKNYMCEEIVTVLDTDSPPKNL